MTTDAQAGGPDEAVLFSSGELLAVRVGQIRALTQDALLAPPGQTRERKEAELAALVDSLQGWPDGPEGDLAARISSASDLRAQFSVADEVLRELGEALDATRAGLLLVELVTETSWPKGVHWDGDREQCLTEAAAVLDDSITTVTVEAVRKGYEKALGRLTRASVGAAAKVTLLAGSVTVGVLSAGTLAPMIGTAIGGTMGLSGAAATSAGLAALGGGSLASGGMGMAGGALLVHVAASTSYKGGRYLATGLASESRKAFLHELAKLHVAYVMIEHDPQLATEIRSRLAEIRGDLTAELGDVSADAGQTRGRWFAHPRDMNRAKDAVADERIRQRLAGCRRAVDAELRFLDDPTWARHAKSLTKAVMALHPTELSDVLRR